MKKERIATVSVSERNGADKGFYQNNRRNFKDYEGVIYEFPCEIFDKYLSVCGSNILKYKCFMQCYDVYYIKYHYF